MRHVVIAALIGALAAYATAWSFGQQASEDQAPQGWERRTSQAPWMNPSVLGPLTPHANAWTLGRFGSLIAPSPQESLPVDVDVPPDGEVLFQLSTEANGAGPALRVTAAGVDGVYWHPDAPAEPLACEGAPGHADSVWEDPQGFVFGDLRCQGPKFNGPGAIRSGLHTVRVGLPEVPQPFWMRLLAGLGGALLVGGMARVTRNGWSSLPLLACSLALFWDAGVLVETLRLPFLDARTLPALLGWVPYAIGQAALASRWRPTSVVVAVGTMAALFLAMSFAMDQLWGRIYLVLAGAALGGVVWLQRNPIRGWNLLSLVLVAGALGSIEYALRWTSAQDAWSVQAAEGAAAISEQFTLLEEGDHTTYPADGFPVAFAPKRGPRIVCLGGSSTGGAYQNDDIRDFYPARMKTSADVVNQGVGAWNSFHIRLYLEARHAELQGDVYTVYLGVNDALQAPADMKTLYAAHRAGSLEPTTVDLRLFQGFRLLVLGLRGKTAAVPPAHFEENLAAIAQTVAPAKVLLMTEAVQPRPEGFAAYKAAMEAVAASHDNVEFADAAVALQGLGGIGFLDQNHLSEHGHRRLASFIDTELARRQWPPAR